MLIPSPFHVRVGHLDIFLWSIGSTLLPIFFFSSLKVFNEKFNYHGTAPEYIILEFMLAREFRYQKKSMSDKRLLFRKDTLFLKNCVAPAHSFQVQSWNFSSHICQCIWFFFKSY